MLSKEATGSLIVDQSVFKDTSCQVPDPDRKVAPTNDAVDETKANFNKGLQVVINQRKRKDVLVLMRPNVSSLLRLERYCVIVQPRMPLR